MAVQILALQQRATANDANGNPLAGAKIYTYETGTTTPLTTYTTSALSVANPNPIVADAAGRFGPIYTNGAVAVKAVITTSADVTVDTLDPAPFAYDSQSGASQISHTPNALLTANNVQGALDQATSLIRAAGFSYGTAGGGVNVRTLTTPFKFTGTIPDGTTVTFSVASGNTGAATLNVDGTGALNMLTVRGTALPPFYIESGQPVQAFKSGASWIVTRPTTTGSNANGTWTRHADGTMTCFHTVNTNSSGIGTWTFPSAYVIAPRVLATAIAASDDRNATTNTPTTTEVAIRGWTVIGNAWEGPVSVMSIGRWY